MDELSEHGMSKERRRRREHATHFFSSMAGQEYSLKSHQRQRVRAGLDRNSEGWHGRCAVARGFVLSGITDSTSVSPFTLSWPAFRPDLPVSHSSQGQIVHFATYIYLFAFYPVLITSQVAKAELTKIRQTVSTSSRFFGCGGSLTQTVTYIWLDFPLSVAQF